MDILKALKKRVTFEHIEGEGQLLDMGTPPEEVAAMKKKNMFAITPEAQRRLAEFKSQFAEGDEVWYYEWRRQEFWGVGRLRNHPRRDRGRIVYLMEIMISILSVCSC